MLHVAPHPRAVNYRLSLASFALGLASLPSAVLGWAILGGAGVLIGFVAATLAVTYGLCARREGGPGRRLAMTGAGLGALAAVWLAAHLVAFATGPR